ncbi:hypothetical protein [Rhodococcus jostii]
MALWWRRWAPVSRTASVRGWLMIPESWAQLSWSAREPAQLS